MIDIKNKKNCSGCEACVNVCPVGCITMVEDEDGVRYPKIDQKKCIKCGQCSKVCPILNPLKKNEEKSIAYGAFNKDKKIIRKSSSGGIFFEIARTIIIEKKGVVFGVKYDKDNNAIFTYAENLNELLPILGSKYVQAKVNNIYKKVREFLNNGRVVLFSGTPCQVAGLKSFLRKEYDNLYTCDFICTGVPSDRILNIFKKHYEELYKSKVVNIQFRNKKYGWRYFSFLITFENGTKICVPRSEANYINAFLKGAFSRPSCYSCKFRSLNSGSDFKLADFWGVDESKNTKYNFLGVSHFIVNTDKGKKLLSGIDRVLNLFESDIEEVEKLNGAFKDSQHTMEEYYSFKKKIKNKSDEEIFNVMSTYNDLNKKQQLMFRIKLVLVKIKYFIKGKL